MEFTNKNIKQYYIIRTGNANQSTRTRRWLNIPRENITCKSCVYNVNRDEFHYIFKYSDVCISNSRIMYLPMYIHVYKL